MTKLTSEYSRNSPGISTMILEASTSDTSKRSSGQAGQGIYMKSREPNMQRVSGAGGQSLHFKVLFLNGS